MMEEVFVIIKPDAISRGLINEIVQRFRQFGKIDWVTGRVKNRLWCRCHYAHISNNPDLADAYAIMETFMSEKLLIGFCLRVGNGIKEAREIAGPTRISCAESGTIRGDFGLKSYPTCYNLVHVADSLEAVRREKKLFLDRSTDYDFGIMSH